VPELPEVEAVCRKLRLEAVGLRIIRVRVDRPGMVKPHRPSWLQARLEGATLDQVERRGKNILLHLSGGKLLHVHLRMTGNLYVIPDVRFRAHTARIWFELDGGKGLIFDDPRTLGRMRLYRAEEAGRLRDSTGVEPLSEQFTPEWLQAAAARTRKPAKIFLMDQRFIAGLGNIYAAEALFRAAIDPRKPAASIRRAKIEALHRAIVDVLTEGVQSAVKAYSKPGVFNEAEEFVCGVYDREGEPCNSCGRTIRRIPQGGRSTYFCAGCQR
jgi:formamidopyrimidine-DNA glycosylase